MAGVRVGGQPGENPTVLVGTIFHEGDSAVKDPLKGVIDREKAEAALLRQDELSDSTGNPCMVDVVGRTGEALIKYLDFVSSVTDAPILVDSPSPEARLEACRHAVEVGLRERIVYNSITPDSGTREIEALKEIELKSAVLLAFSECEFSPEEKLNLLHGESEPLLMKAEKAGVRNVLVDVSLLDVASMAYAAESIRAVKDALGLPSGCSPANALNTWHRINELAPQAKKTCLASLCVFTRCFGADFILYGPVKLAEAVFPACAMADAILTYSLTSEGYEPEDKNTPLYKIF
ncbi:MAG: tetrahydromethanopterin S-methyltransferase subunit H [Candidatus Freyarchaeota archaeon]|nr:tetrahydromethanopterin S-methyltransferase subunit H [Candidatus Jordarchaeia archaeon]